MGSLIRAELARVLLEEISDPGLKQIVVNDVELSKDLKHARIFFSLSGAESPKPKEVNKAFHRAQPFLKRKLADNLQLRFVPDLNFVEDTHNESVNRLYDLFDEVGAPEKKQ